MESIHQCIIKAKDKIYSDFEELLKVDNKKHKEWRNSLVEESKSRIELILHNTKYKNFLTKTPGPLKDEEFYIKFFKIVGRPQAIWRFKTYQSTSEREAKFNKICRSFEKLSKLLSELHPEEYGAIMLNSPLKPDSEMITIEDVIMFLRSSEDRRNTQRVLNPEYENQDPPHEIRNSTLQVLKFDRNKINGLGLFDSIYPEVLEITKRSKRSDDDSFRNYTIRELYLLFMEYFAHPHQQIIIEIIFDLFSTEENEVLLETSQISDITKPLRTRV